MVLAGGYALTGGTDASDDTAGTAAPSSTMQAKASPGVSAEIEGAAPPENAENAENAEKEEVDEADEGEDKEKEREEDVDPASIPSSGPGTFITADSTGSLIGGSEKVVTYRVQVEDGIGISADEVAAEVERVFADPRGWTADGEVGFRRVSGGTSDMRVRLATAATVDHICGQYGLDTGGEVNCRVGQDVMVNLKRWLLATQYYADDVTEYRALIINHEVGHFLGHGHETCPGAGKPAPAMMQQIKGLKGCKPNAWPYDRTGRRITGPSVP